jgi:DNA adenine methylase/adenine-specific DNA-methyltransferase
MENTKTKKIPKRHTPFANKRTVEDALVRLFEQFRDSGAIVMSYSSNAVPEAERMVELLRTVKSDVEMRSIDYNYSFGTHPAAVKRSAQELIFIGR